MVIVQFHGKGTYTVPIYMADETFDLSFLHMANDFMASFVFCSLRQSVPGAAAPGSRPRQAVRHEGSEESQHRTEDQDN